MAVLHNDEEQIPLETDSADMTDSNNLLDEAFVALRSSSPFTRLTFIKNKMIPYIKSLETRPNATVYELLCLVIQLAPRYNDSRSRNSVINVLEAFYDLDSLFTINTFISLLAKDVDKCLNPAVAVSTSLILVEWTSALIVFSAKGRLVPPIELLEFQAKLLTSCIVLPLKPTLRKHAVVVTRRALKECFCQEIDGKKGALAQYFISELVKGDITSILLLGQIADVAYHTGAKDLVQENKKAILGLYLTKVLGSKKAVDAKISAAYNDFFRRFITLEELNKDILPSVEKALLRNPEVVLDGVLVHLFSSLSDDIDPSEMVFEKLLKSFLPLLKSSNTAVRLHSIQTFKNIVSRCKNQDLASTCISTILDASALANPEQRALCSSYLGYFPASKKTSTEILKAVESSYAKELYENVQMALSKAYMAHLEFLLKSETLPNTTITFFVERLKEKKVKLQFSWLSGLGSLILNSTQLSNPLSELAVLTSPLLYSVWQQVSTNPTQALQAGTVVSGLVCISVGLRLSEFPENSFSKMSFHKTCLDWTTAKPFPLWSRIYTKLTSVEEQIWNVTALQCIGEYTEPHLLQKFAIDWVLAMLYFTTEIKLHFSVRTMAIKVFSHVVGHRINLLDHAIVESFWILVLASEGTSSSVEFSSSNLKHFPRVIASLAVSVSDEQKNSLAIVLVKLLFLMSHPVFAENIPNTQLWTDICLRVGQDPHDLVVQYSDKFMEIIYHQGLSNQDSVLKACEILVFVAPDVLTRRLIGLFEEDLSPTIYQGIGSLEIAIWKAPDDAPYINSNKNYETEKWETEVRAQIAQKKGIPQKKLTKEEEKAIADQMAKEKIIRARVEESYTKAMKGLGIIRALCIGSQEGIEVWLARAIKVLLIKGLESTRDLVGDVGIDTYLKLSKVATSRLGLFSESVGTATLRSYTLQDMPEQFTHERSTELITRVLYKLRFTSEQRPFDVAPFIYTLPLLLNIVINNQLDDRSSEEYDEQLTLALEVLASNSSLLIDLNIDRESIFRAVLDLVQRSPQYFKKVKHYVVSTTELIKNNISPQEIDVLAKGSISPEPAVRTISLQSLDALDLIDMGYCEEIWIACQDDDMVINELANKIWDDNGLEVKEESVSSLLMYLNNKSSYIRQVASKAISASIDEFPDKLRPVWNELSGLYRIKVTILIGNRLNYIQAEPVRPQYDEYGMLIKESLNAEDPWVSRHGVANTLVLLADRFEGELLDELVQFLTDESLGDRNSDVRQMMLKAGLEIILVGHSRIEAIAGKLEEFLSRPVNKLDERQDFVQESVVILYGSLARHLKKGDPRIGDIMTRLISALKTPSEAVQQAVATCLSPLIKLVDVPQRGFVDKMLKEALSSNSYAERKGGAYGLAGVIKGYGISALKNCEVLSHLQTAIENRKAPKMRQGSLFCFEALSQLLGRLFEPFIASLLPYLVIAFGDPDSEVREASQECARTIMSNLSGHCVNVILPFLLSGLTEDQWRSKKGAIELLGSMAYCAPRQLSYSLPEIVPRLSEVLTDSHAQVRNSANQSLS
ncbi:Translational activator gcn1, partial [Neolecta irregularis DAH-3]